VAEAVVSVVCPPTVSVPLDVKDEVAVIVPIVAVPPVRDEMNPVTVLNSVAKRLEEVALVLDKLVIVPVVEKSVLIVPTVVEAVLSTV